jgi:hypothetical protein
MLGKTGKPDYRLLRYSTDLLLCSRCLRSGLRTHIRQLISSHHKPRSLCRRCHEADTLGFGRQTTGQAIRFLAAARARRRNAAQRSTRS